MPRESCLMSVTFYPAVKKRLSEMAEHCLCSEAQIVRIAVARLYSSGVWRAGLLPDVEKDQGEGTQLALVPEGLRK